MYIQRIEHKCDGLPLKQKTLGLLITLLFFRRFYESCKFLGYLPILKEPSEQLQYISVRFNGTVTTKLSSWRQGWVHSTDS